jgi:hypothetical protein
MPLSSAAAVVPQAMNALGNERESTCTHSIVQHHLLPLHFYITTMLTTSADRKVMNALGNERESTCTHSIVQHHLLPLRSYITPLLTTSADPQGDERLRQLMLMHGTILCMSCSCCNLTPPSSAAADPQGDERLGQRA